MATEETLVSTSDLDLQILKAPVKRYIRTRQI